VSAVADALGDWDLTGPDLMDPEYMKAAQQQAAWEVTAPTVLETSTIVEEQLAEMQQGLLAASVVLAASVARQHAAFAPELAAAAQAQAMHWAATQQQAVNPWGHLPPH
jgi:hypothetical protein